MMGTADHPMRKIRPLIDTARIRQLCEPLYAENGRPSIPPEQLFLALLGGYLLGVTSERALVRELTGNLVLRWFVGLDLDQMPWDHATFSHKAESWGLILYCACDTEWASGNRCDSRI
ncbi:MAG: transposase [Nitrospira sp.]